jgi:hypothetical protein
MFLIACSPRVNRRIASAFSPLVISGLLLSAATPQTVMAQASDGEAEQGLMEQARRVLEHGLSALMYDAERLFFDPKPLGPPQPLAPAPVRQVDLNLPQPPPVPEVVIPPLPRTNRRAVASADPETSVGTPDARTGTPTSRTPLHPPYREESPVTDTSDLPPAGSRVREKVRLAPTGRLGRLGRTSGEAQFVHDLGRAIGTVGAGIATAAGCRRRLGCGGRQLAGAAVGAAIGGAVAHGGGAVAGAMLGAMITAPTSSPRVYAARSSVRRAH